MNDTLIDARLRKNKWTFKDVNLTRRALGIPELTLEEYEKKTKKLRKLMGEKKYKIEGMSESFKKVWKKGEHQLKKTGRIKITLKDFNKKDD